MERSLTVQLGPHLSPLDPKDGSTCRLLATSRVPSPGRLLAHVVRITTCLSARELIPSKPRGPDITREIREDEESCQAESSENRRRLSKRARQRDNLSELTEGHRQPFREEKPSRIWGLRGHAARRVVGLLQVSERNCADCTYKFYHIEDD